MVKENAIAEFQEMPAPSLLHIFKTVSNLHNAQYKSACKSVGANRKKQNFQQEYQRSIIHCHQQKWPASRAAEIAQLGER